VIVVQPKVLARWVPWFFGLGLMVAVVMFATHYSQEMAFAQLVLHARPAWLLVAILLQVGTYVTEARIWQRVLYRASISKPLRSYIGLALAKLFMDQAIPSVGLSGTLLVIRALDRREVSRSASMAAVVIDLVSYYTAYILALGVALVIVWVLGDLTLLMALPACIFAPLAAAVPITLLWASRGGTLPGWLERLPLIRPALRALGEATPAVSHDIWLITRCTGLQLAILALDAGTLWTMLCALGLEVNPAPVFASFMLSTLARTLGVVPGGLGVFEGVSVATLKLIGVPVATGLAATLLFRFFTFWLPMAPGLILARREARA